MTAPRRSGAATGGSAESPVVEHAWPLARIAYLLLAVILAGGGLLYFLLMPSSAPTTMPDTTAPAVAMTASSANNPFANAASQSAGTWPPPVARTAPASANEGNLDPTQDISSVIKPGETPTMPEVIARLRKAGVTGGLAAFSPPGTRPPLIGLAVPEDFVLPEGYVRHHQATDDGQRIEAILMFAPDRQFCDAANRPIAVPANRVVPPEFAPPGLPIRLIVLPKPIDPAAR